jgi:uncharacterized protein (TIGR02600 family)
MKECEPRRLPARGRRGVALVVVLGMLVLVLVLVVAFLSSVSTELQSAKKYSGGADARAQADSAVSLVISQIQDATSAPRLAWASQPGMIRTYDASGNLDTAYKLYSSGRMRVSGSFNPVASLADEVPANWASSPEVFVDLNRPVAVSGTNRYPILDPSAVGAGFGGGALVGSLPPIEGSFIDTTSPAVAGSGNPVPMPVQWLYILNSGSMVPVNPANGQVSAASKDDPIVGRIAFWTDDETSKVNINTASEGTFWDRPLADSADGTSERRLAESLPVQNEFQRYPGHPAMTSLSAIFPNFGGTGAPRETLYDIIPRVAKGGSLQGTVTINRNSPPIVPDNQRLFSTVDEFLFSASNFSGSLRALNPDGNSGALNVTDLERTRFFLTANSRAPEVNQFNKPRVTLWPLQANTESVGNPAGATFRSAKDRLIAFCSTIGKVPYYFQRYNTYTSPGQNPIPSSQSPTMDWDLIPRNQELYSYLRFLTSQSVPGLGGSLQAKYPGSRDQILTQMWDLTRSMVNTFNTGEAPNYFYTPFNKAGMIAGQGQVVPLEPRNGTKGFGRFPTITEAALIFYNRDPLTVSGTVPPNGIIATGTNVLATFEHGTVLNNYKLEDNTFGRTDYVITGTTHVLNVDEPGPKNLGTVLILEPFNPTPGAPPWTADVRFVVRGLEKLGIGFPNQALVNKVNAIDSTYNATSQTGLEQFLQYPTRRPKTLGATDPTSPAPQFYPFASTFTVSGSTFNITEGEIEIDIYQGSDGPLELDHLVQTVKMRFPAVSGLPIPRAGKSALVDYDKDATKSKESTQITLAHARHETFRNFDNRMSYSRNQGGPSTSAGRWGIAEDGQHGPLPLIMLSGDLGDTVRSVEARWLGNIRGDLRLIAGLKTVPNEYFEAHGTLDPVLGGALYTDTSLTGRVSHSLTYDISPGNSDTTNANGYYPGTGGLNDTRGKLEMAANYTDIRRGQNARDGTMPVAPRGLQGAFLKVNGIDYPGDWDNGPGSITDGPYVNMPDQASATSGAGVDNLYFAKGGYINSNGIVESGASYSPNRQIASAVAFGSLPSVIDPGNPSNSQPWRTLLFGRQPAAGSNHPGFGKPFSGPPFTEVPDHAFLDLFTMPIVEPYAISEPFSTAGKVNINYQIVPFTYLTRSTGVRAVLKSTNIMAIPHTEGHSYKYRSKGPPPFRYSLNLDEQIGTLKGFQDRFNAGDIFRAASEICTISLVPKTRSDGISAPHSPTYDSMEDWWEHFKLTGDNAREAPYGHIYPRITTKSNTFTVHVIAQSITKANGTSPTQFVDGKDQITGEFRGSFLIERYLDPNSDSLVNSSGNPTTETDPDGMVGPYKFRVISTKKFAP